MITALLAVILPQLTRAAEPTRWQTIETAYVECQRSAADDDGRSRCLVTASNEINAATSDVLTKLLTILDGEPSRQTQARMLRTAHERFQPSRDADCALRAAVTVDDEADAEYMRRDCAYRANHERLKNYERFLSVANDL